jgi:SOS response regulatory protein OraA/RecX
MFINKMKNDLYNMGYDKEMIDDKLSHIEYESNALEKDLEKAKKKYISDKNKIISSLLRKGYSYEEINSKI